MPKMKRKSRSQRNLENKLHKRRLRHLAKLALLSKHAKQTTEIGTQIFDRNEMVTSPDHTNNQPTPIHSSDNSQNEYQPTLIYSNDTSQSEYKPTLIFSNDNSQIEYKPTLIYSNVNSRCEYQPTLIHSNDYSQSEYQQTLIYSNDNSRSEYQSTLMHSNEISQSEYQPTLIHNSDNSQSEYKPTLIHSNDNSQNEYQPTLIHSDDNSQSESSQTHIYVYGDEPLTCGICCKGFNQMRLLRVHMRTHNEEQPHKCDICSKGFKGKKEFQIHMRTHTGEQPYKCDICSEGFIGETKLQLHMRTHTGENLYKCDICCKAFGCRTSLTRHRNIHHGHLQSQIEISDQKVKALKNKLREFFRKSIGKKPDESGEVNTMANVRNVFSNGQDPTGTKTANEQNKYIVNDKSFSQDKQSLLHKRKETSDNLPFTCEICGKGFKGEIRLQVHMRTHTGETPYKCDICFKGFTQRCTLANHMKIHAVHCKVCDFANCQCHLQKYSAKGEFAASKNILRKFLVKQTEIKPDKHSVNNTMANVSNHLSNDQEPKRTETCGICCKEFKGKKVFLIHMRTHTGEQPYKCDICFKGFIGETKLQLHMRTHTGEKPYECDICCKAFGRRTSLTRHRNTHHVHHGHLQSQIPKRDIRINAASKNKLREYFRKNNGKKPDKSGVDMHFRNVDNGQDPTGTKTSNEQNICVVNDKSFSLDKQSLLPKRKETSDNLPFTCKICDKGFKGKLRLQIHMRTHTGETPYKCDICSKGFTHRCTLANHMKIHAVHCNVCDFANCQCHLQKYSPKSEFAASKNILRKFLIKQTEIKPDKHGVNNTMANVSIYLSNDQEPTRTETENEQFICGECGEIFSGDTILVLHMKKHACDITNTMANDRNDISNDHDHTISNIDQDNHDHTISYNDQHHHDHDDHTILNTDQEFTISYNDQDHHGHTISTTDQDYTILNTDQEFTISYNDQDHHDHRISNTDQDHTILNTDQEFIISKNDQHLQDHTIFNTDQEFTISKNDQHHHDHTISNTDQEFTISKNDQYHTISSTDQDHTISNTDQEFTISKNDQHHHDHTILNTDQEFTISKNDHHHHDHIISNIKIEQFLCVCGKSFSEENKLRLHTKITHKSLLSVIT